jgi:hypothetical protein
MDAEAPHGDDAVSPRRLRRGRVGTGVAIAAADSAHASDQSPTGVRVLAIVDEEARRQRETQGELTRNRMWGSLSVLVGLVGVGIGLLAVAPGNVKTLAPIVVAIVGVGAIACFAFASRASAHRWGWVGRSRKAAPLTGGLLHVAQSMAEQRANARLGVARAVSSDG